MKKLKIKIQTHIYLFHFNPETPQIAEEHMFSQLTILLPLTQRHLKEAYNLVNIWFLACSSSFLQKKELKKNVTECW